MRRLNLTAEENFIEAMEEAKRCDTERKEAIRNGTQESLPPLHSIPISIKDVVIYGCLNFSTNKKERDVQLALSTCLNLSVKKMVQPLSYSKIKAQLYWLEATLLKPLEVFILLMIFGEQLEIP